MKLLMRCYHFLGGVYFAIILIAVVALFVMAGTFIESSTQSHQYASLFTYGNPFFALLLWGFFINILFAATRRWPFQVKHVPFLITHLGLLMLLGGVIIKHYFGVQGTLNLIEGSGSHLLTIPDSYAIYMESNDSRQVERYPLQRSLLGKLDPVVADTSDGVHIRLMQFTPHATERWATWFKGSHLHINGLTPFPVYDEEPIGNPLPISGVVRFYPDSPPHDIYAIRSLSSSSTLEHLFLQNASIRFSHRPSSKVLAEFPLSQLVASPQALSSVGMASAELADFSTEPLLIVALEDLERHRHQIQIPLSGDEALINHSLSMSALGSFPIAVDIIHPQTVAFIEDPQQEIAIAAISPHGKITRQLFSKNSIDSLIVYDEGFGGYGVHSFLPVEEKSLDRQQKEHNRLVPLQMQLQQADAAQLISPLQLFQRACLAANTDFPETLTQFLIHWDATYCWIYPREIPLPSPLKATFSAIDWKAIPSVENCGCQWTVQLFSTLDPALQSGKDALSVLEQKQWPLIAPLKEIENNDFAVLTQVTQQLFAAAEQQKDLFTASSSADSAEASAALFSAYLRNYGMHLQTLTITPREDDGEKGIAIETFVASRAQPAKAGVKLEDNIPAVTLQVRQGSRAQQLSLSYDRSVSGLKWPILSGKYLVRFQPQLIELPYHLRLRQARQINYAHSSQPYSFESDLTITDRRSHGDVETTISMNNVYETSDGYRFYLSGMTPSDESAIKRVTVVVNRDPAKYWLTYPGAVILSIGIILLFLMKPYSRRKL